MSRPSATSSLVLAFVIGATPVATAAPSRCTATKVRAAANRVLRSTSCHANGLRRAQSASITCLARAVTALDRAFARVEARRTDCLTTGDAAIVSLGTDGFVSGLLSALASADDAKPSRRCRARLLLAAASRARASLRCAAKGATIDAPPAVACVDALGRGYERAVAKIDGRDGCTIPFDVPGLARSADGFAAALAMALGLPPPATTTTTSTTIVTSTSTSIAPTTTVSTSTSTSSSSTTTSSSTSTSLPGQSTTSTLPGSTTTTSTTSSSTSSSSSSSSTTSSSTSTSSSSTSTLPTVVSFALHVQPILTSRCAVPGCHTGVVPQQGLNLSTGKAYGALVGASSEECPLFLRVRAGDPTTSYVLFKLDGPPQPCFVGNQMPSGGDPPLSVEERTLIRTWIAQGALNN